MNTLETQINTIEQTEELFKIGDLSNSFLGDQKDLFSNEKILEINKNSDEYRKILSNTFKEKTDNNLTVEYDKRKKCFEVNNKHYTMGADRSAKKTWN